MSRIQDVVSGGIKRRVRGALLVASSMVVAAACGSGMNSPIAPGATGASAGGTGSALLTGAPTGLAVQQSKIAVCHRTKGANGFVLISVAAASVEAHLQHGDGRVGDPVPGQPGMVFGADCVPIAAQDPPVLDQSFDAPSFLSFGFGGESHLAQTFTVGITGVLRRVDVEIRRDAGIPDLLFDIRPTIGGVPVESDAAALANVVIPSASIPTDFTFVSVDLSSAQIAVSAGDVLAIVLRAPGAGGALNYSWQGSAVSGYGAGADFFRVAPSPTWNGLFGDLGFQTFVAPAVVPSP